MPDWIKLVGREFQHSICLEDTQDLQIVVDKRPLRTLDGAKRFKKTTSISYQNNHRLSRWLPKGITY